MTEKRSRTLRCVLLFLAVWLAICPLSARADDGELLGMLPGTWTCEETSDEEPAALEADQAQLTLEKDGTMSLSFTLAGESVRDLAGTWAFELVSGGMDRLTLTFPAREEYAGAECVYDIYAESWVESDTQHTYLILEETGVTGVSPLQDMGIISPLAFHMEQGPNMRVANCKSYVSLREKPSKSAKRLAKVPLGASVLAFPDQSRTDGFLLCVYQDTYGYILSEYLEAIN